ncbi:MAG: MotA/TolQ/ExbB proton channel family protein [Methanobacteriaceae archaeon]
MTIPGSEILTSIIHIVSTSLLVPVVILLIIFVIYSILSFGGFVSERLKRKPFKIDEIEGLLRNFNNSSNYQEIESYIKETRLNEVEINILLKIVENHNLGNRSRESFATKLIEEQELAYSKIVKKTDILIRLGPILGLLGTLIPLGPGLAALGTGDIVTLSQSLIIAFDTTVTGLATGSVGFIISKYRKQWYAEDLSTLETIANSLLEVLEK